MTRAAQRLIVAPGVVLCVLAIGAASAQAATLTGPERVPVGKTVTYRAAGLPANTVLAVYVSASIRFSVWGNSFRNVRTDDAGTASVRFRWPRRYRESLYGGSKPWKVGQRFWVRVWVHDENDITACEAPSSTTCAERRGRIGRRGRGGACRKPSRRTKSRRACFQFNSSGSTRFQCKLTGERVPKRLKSWRRCSSPKRYRGLNPGRKVFRVRAVSGGRTGKPDRHVWRVVA